MSKPIVYVAHPVSGDAKANAMRTVDWIHYLTKADQARIYVAPWVAEVLAFADHIVPDDFYDRVLEDDCAVVRRLDAVLMVGGRISRGMALERDAARAAGKLVIDASNLATPADAMREGFDLPGLLEGQL